MAYSFERSIVIHAAPEQVYDNLLDVASHKNWGEMTELELLYKGPVKVGSRWRSVGVMGKDVMRDECTVVALERPPHLLRVFLPQPAATLDVGEEEGRDGGLVVHGRLAGRGTQENAETTLYSRA